MQIFFNIKRILSQTKANKVYPTKLYIRFLTYVIFTFIILFYRVRRKMPPEVRKLKAPYLVLSNHVGYWDPFLVGHFLPNFTHFVSSDAAFKGKFLRFFLTRLGTIPKKKNIRDTKVIRDIKAIIQQGENVGLFPEAVRNWAGSTFQMDPSIIKLIRFLNVPVVVATLKGMNLFNPRWGKNLRYTQVEVEYQLLFQPHHYKKLTDDVLFSQLTQAMLFDEVAHQQTNMNKIYSNKRAEYISHALYVCPQCNAIDSFTATSNTFCCTHCKYQIRINAYGFFERITEGQLYFNNIRDWYSWEEKWLQNHVLEKLQANSTDIIFEDRDSQIFHSKANATLNFIGTATIQLYINKIVVKFNPQATNLIFNFTDLQTINPQVNERIELFYNHEVYRFIGGKEGVSGLKWEVAANTIWKHMGQVQKLSPYIAQHT